jgi:GTP-binding protein
MARSMVISLIGRPNVGKSTLFNRLMKKANRAITFDQPGVTRDRHYGVMTLDEEIDEKQAILVDTGGFYPEKIQDLEKFDEHRGKNNTCDHFFNIMKEHAEIAIEESDLVLFITDIREGVLPFDHDIANFIRTKKKEVWLIVNKFDSDGQIGGEAEFYSLGFNDESTFLMSSAHGRGVETLKEALSKKIAELEEPKLSDDLSLQTGIVPRQNVVGRLAIIGAPNAGKSTLLNQLLKSNRALVSDVPGTTVDPIGGYFDLNFGQDVTLLDKKKLDPIWDKKKIFSSDFDLKQQQIFEEHHDPGSSDKLENSLDEMYKKVFEGEENSEVHSGDELETTSEVHSGDEVETTFEVKSGDEVETTSELNPVRSIHIVDTAGIRQKKKIKSFIESQSVFRSLRCITEADVVIYLLDVTKGLGHQDRRLLGIALEKGKSLVIALNKVDLLKEKLSGQKEREEWLSDLKDDIPWLDFCELVPLSAKEGTGLKRLKRAIQKTLLTRKKVIPTGHLNRFVHYLVDKNPIMIQKAKGVRFKVKYALMVKNGPPTILLYSNKSLGIPENFKQYLKNNLRKEFDLYNTPVHIIFRSGSDQGSGKKKALGYQPKI